ncbi:MAG TPA: nucleotidyltransferase family protein [Pyrinomonadaceae bacterium]|jgi:CTP:molybdopterin cytidylyltransferase MocA|nr:nucleotidyltransferase family protein [Pyrinomonadaceae bacterium]
MRDEESEQVFHPSSLIPHPSIAAILLAAGRSRRMGAFKPLLPFGKRLIVEACIGNLLAGGVEEIVVVIGHRADEIRERLTQLPVRFVVNAEAESEMSVSIARGVEQIPAHAEAVFVALVDQPAIPPEVIRLLIAERRRTGARLVQPEHNGRGGHPVLIDLSFREELMNLDPQRGLRALLELHRETTLRLPVASPYVVRDMDTWDDYRALYREVFGTEPPENSRQ